MKAQQAGVRPIGVYGEKKGKHLCHTHLILRCPESFSGKQAITIDTSNPNMSEYDYDLITIGAGSGGTRASRIAAQSYKAKVATIELPFAFVSSETRGGAGGT